MRSIVITFFICLFIRRWLSLENSPGALRCQRHHTISEYSTAMTLVGTAYATTNFTTISYCVKSRALCRLSDQAEPQKLSPLNSSILNLYSSPANNTPERTQMKVMARLTACTESGLFITCTMARYLPKPDNPYG